MACRKNIRDLTPAEKADLVAAFKALKSNGKYDQYVQWHVDAMANATPPSVPTSTRNSAHRGPAFLPWHREFLRRLEADMQAEVPGVAIPYWNWTEDSADPSSSPVWANDLLGGDGDSSDGDLVQTGPFAYDAMDPNTWETVDGSGSPAGGLRRTFGVEIGSVPNIDQLDAAQALTPYDQSPWNRNSGGYRNSNEGWATVDGNSPPNLHNRVHVWVGGDMLPGTSPNDPVFFLHHCFVDKMWADWQGLHPGESYVPDDSESADLDGHRLSDTMYPWSARPVDLLNHRDLGIVYDTDDPVVTPQTASLTFNDVPEGETTVRAAVFSVSACTNVHLEIIAGPTVTSGPAGTTFGTPLGASVIVPPSDDQSTPKGRVWISYTGTDDGDAATGTVTIRCVETSEQWVVPITANTINRPTVASVLVLDKSGSMNSAAGDGRTRLEVLKESAPIFVDLLREDDGIGIVRFDDDASEAMPVTPAGPLTFGAGRVGAKSAISSHTAGGNTSIGDGVDVANTSLSTAAGYDEQAIVVLTDGRENRSLYIADVAGVINDRVFGIGLGKAEHINPAALTALTNGTGGYVLMTGTLDTDDYFILSKYYLQILAGVSNNEIVLDPDGWLLPGQKHRIPFRLNETDISCDAILLNTALPETFRFMLETPTGEIIDPGVAAATPGVDFAVGSSATFYRMNLPVPISGGEAREGSWNVVLQLDPRGYKKYLASLKDNPDELKRVRTHGLRYSVNIHSFSNLRMRANLSQDSLEPGANLTLRATLTEYGLPVEGRARVWFDLEYPDGSTISLTLPELNAGVFETSIAATVSGVYRFRVFAEGHTLRARPFTRERLVTGSVWRGGDNPPPTTDSDPSERNRRNCELLSCLLSQASLVKYLKRQKIDVEELRRCIKRYCDRVAPGRSTTVGKQDMKLPADVIRLLTQMLRQGDE
jgi:hypothetical protein